MQSPERSKAVMEVVRALRGRALDKALATGLYDHLKLKPEPAPEPAREPGEDDVPFE